ncbi:MAG: response regulator [Alphaproteobacteria bacterium]
MQHQDLTSIPTILLADDDKLVTMLLSKTLNDNGYSVTVVHDGEEAVEKALGSHYDFIITDILMPGIEGIEVISEILEKQPLAKIIAISSDGSAGYTTLLQLAQTVGASATLSKPISPSNLLETLDSIR